MQAIIDQCRKLLDLSRSLLAAAQAGDWERAVELEQTRANVIQSMGALPTLELSVRQEVAQLIEDILRCDAESAPLIQAEMADLRSLLNSVSNERKLGANYL